MKTTFPLSLVKSLARACFLAVALVLSVQPVLAELPPSAYKEMQSRAPEVLRIRVLSVQSTEKAMPHGKDVSVRLRARVLGVTRSATKRKVGDVITINYVRRIHNQPMAGPSEVPLLQKGNSYPAFLSGSAKAGYSPAAGGYSFEVVK